MELRQTQKTREQTHCQLIFRAFGKGTVDSMDPATELQK